MDLRDIKTWALIFSFIAMVLIAASYFVKTLEKAQERIGENKVELPVEESDIICEKCGKRMIIKSGRFG